MSVINLSSVCDKGIDRWMKDFSNVYIGGKVEVQVDGKIFSIDDSPFVNPFGEGERATKQYEKYIKSKIDADPWLRSLTRALKGKSLGCWCKPRCCHGDVLIKIIDDLQ